MGLRAELLESVDRHVRLRFCDDADRLPKVLKRRTGGREEEGARQQRADGPSPIRRVVAGHLLSLAGYSYGGFVALDSFPGGLSFTWKEWDQTAAGPEAVAAQAEVFLHAGDLCIEHRDRGGKQSIPLVIPAVVNWCLSIELYLKALIFNDGRHPGRIHRLDSLLGLLANDDRAGIEREWRPRVATLSLSTLLHEVGDYFVDVRYDYEVTERSYSEGAIRIALTAIAATAGTKTWREGPLPAQTR